MATGQSPPRPGAISPCWQRANRWRSYGDARWKHHPDHRGGRHTHHLDSDPTATGNHSIWSARSGNGNITLNADHFILNAATDDIVAGTGIVTIQPITSTEAIQLGTTTDAELDLSNAELGRITAGTLRIGALSSTGNLTVSPPRSAFPLFHADVAQWRQYQR